MIDIGFVQVRWLTAARTALLGFSAVLAAVIGLVAWRLLANRPA